MGFALENVVPWGRSFEEYTAMFALDDSDLGKRILGVGDGPAAFNAVLTERGGRIVSADPLYVFDGEQIRGRIDAVYDDLIKQVESNAEHLRLELFGSAEALGRARMRAMARFLDDYDAGKSQGRYLAAALPNLPLRDRSFDLAVCSHFLFLYGDRFDEAFHRRAVSELCRVAAEVRIFPLLDLSHRLSPYLEPVMAALERQGYRVSIETVDYEFQIGAKEMLHIGGD